MPNLYDQDSGNGVLFGDNTRRVTPSNRLGTRAIQRWVIYTQVDIETDWQLPNSLYSQLVRAIQQNVELYAVYMPGESFFNTDDFDYSFSIDAAADTSVDLWTATGSTFGSDIHPMDWNFNNDGNYNTNTKILIQVVEDALDAAGVDTTCWVSPSYTVGDMSWPLEAGDSPPGAERNVGNAKADPRLAPQPGDTPEILKQKRLRFLAKLRSI